MNRRTQSNLRLGLSAVLLLTLSVIALRPAAAQIDFAGTASTEQDSLVAVSPAFSASSAQAGNTYQSAVTVEIQTGWHINSAQPYQDWLIPAELTFDTVNGLIPHSIELSLIHI